VGFFVLTTAQGTRSSAVQSIDTGASAVRYPVVRFPVAIHPTSQFRLRAEQSTSLLNTLTLRHAIPINSTHLSHMTIEA
jgi:hypothetical protein